MCIKLCADPTAQECDVQLDNGLVEPNHTDTWQACPAIFFGEIIAESTIFNRFSLLLQQEAN